MKSNYLFFISCIISIYLIIPHPTTYFNKQKCVQVFILLHHLQDFFCCVWTETSTTFFVFGWLENTKRATINDIVLFRRRGFIFCDAFWQRKILFRRYWDIERFIVWIFLPRDTLQYLPYINIFKRSLGKVLQYIQKKLGQSLTLGKKVSANTTTLFMDRHSGLLILSQYLSRSTKFCCKDFIQRTWMSFAWFNRKMPCTFF